jgi:hypothetical protein
VLSSHPGFRLDTWTEAARAFGETDVERARLEEWAKRLVTSWAEREDFTLTEYANRDWSGLVGSYYRRRWTIWFEQLRAVLAGTDTTPVDWYEVADEWVSEPTPRSESAAPSPTEAARIAVQFVGRRSHAV